MINHLSIILLLMSRKTSKSWLVFGQVSVSFSIAIDVSGMLQEHQTTNKDYGITSWIPKSRRTVFCVAYLHAPGLIKFNVLKRKNKNFPRYSRQSVSWNISKGKDRSFAIIPQRQITILTVFFVSKFLLSPFKLKVSYKSKSWFIPKLRYFIIKKRSNIIKSKKFPPFRTSLKIKFLDLQQIAIYNSNIYIEIRDEKKFLPTPLLNTHEIFLLRLKTVKKKKWRGKSNDNRERCTR